jgi:hypothetical protein
MSRVNIVCKECKKEVAKRTGEVNRRKRLGSSDFYCSRSCANRDGNRKSPRGGNTSLLVANNRRDEYTPFRWFLSRVKARPRKGRSDITVEYLKWLWEYQQGICPFTGWLMQLPNSTVGWKEGLVKIKSASLDRYDNSKGYLQGNVRFVSVIANYAKAQFSDQEVMEFCHAVVAKYPRLPADPQNY